MKDKRGDLLVLIGAIAGHNCRLPGLSANR